MKILKIIHGYPPLYNAGSEVYSQLLCHGLVKHHKIHVFTREENPFLPDFTVSTSHDPLEPNITLSRINIPLEKFRYRYQHAEVDQALVKILERFSPDIVHIGHLNHLSTSMIDHIAQRKIPMVYTLHDYWLMCPRGQFIQRNSSVNENLWKLCEGQENRKCANQCYSGYFSGSAVEYDIDLDYWTNWVHRRMHHIHTIAEKIDCFIAPSRYLYHRYVQDFKIPTEKIIYLDYGFDLERLQNRQRIPNEPFTFGYIGTHIPAKGIQQLITAFGLLQGDCRLRIWGRPRSQSTEALYKIASDLPKAYQERIEWCSEYVNNEIVRDVFNHVDCIVVPSIWVENSPLVIHEALQVRVPVITANVGGMSEYVQHEVNGLLFQHRDVRSLGFQMQRLIDNPAWGIQLGSRGYIQSEDGNIPNLNIHVAEIERIYDAVIAPKGVN